MASLGMLRHYAIQGVAHKSILYDVIVANHMESGGKPGYVDTLCNTLLLIHLHTRNSKTIYF